MTVLLAGAFGQGNVGDEALLQAFRTALPADVPVVATTSDTAGTARSHGCATVDADDPTAVARAAVGARAVVYAGGTIFKTLHPSTGRAPTSLLRNAALLATACAVTRTPLALVGVGASTIPAGTARLYTRTTARLADLLILRDHRSAAHLLDAGVRRPLTVGSDAAWTLVEPSPPRPDTGDGVRVAISYHAGGRDLPAMLAAALDRLPSGTDVTVEPWQVQPAASTDDRRLAREIVRRTRRRVRVDDPPADLADATERFRGASVVVSLRFHGALAAAAAGTRFVAVAHESKLAALAERLGQPVVAPHELEDRLAGAVEDARASEGPDAGAVAEERRRAEAAFARLRALVTGHRPGPVRAPLEQVPAP